MAKSRSTRTRKAGARRVKSAAKRAAKTARRKGTRKQASRKRTKKQVSRKRTKKQASRKSPAARGRKSAAKRTPRQTRRAGRATKRSTKSARKTRKSARPSGGALRAARSRGAARKTATRGRKSAPSTAKRPAALERERRRLPEAIATLPDDAQVTLGESVHRSSRVVNGDVTGGDIDATRQTAYDTGDEAPGGDNPTPDQDIVDQIGHSLGLEYDDEEELKGADKVEQRDRHRWELDPASSEDYNDRD